MKKPIKRNPDTTQYNLVIPTELYQQLTHLADKQGVTTIELLRKFIKLGLWVMNVEDKDKVLILKDAKSETRIMFF